MASGFRILLRLTVLLRPAAFFILLALYLSPLATHGWRTTLKRGPLALESRRQHRAALAQGGASAHATPVYFQAALFAPLKWFGSDLCYTELTKAQIRVIQSMATR